MSTFHFLLMKRDSLSRNGTALSAHEAATALLDAGVWPLWEHTRNRKVIQAGAEVAVYLAGGNHLVVATAKVASNVPWSTALARTYPLMLDGVPFAALQLRDVRKLPTPRDVKLLRNELSFLRSVGPKWGVAFMGGTRAVSVDDFAVLTGAGQ